MPRYFFDIYDGVSIRDDRGVECKDLAAARREALRAAGDMLGDKSESWSGDPWQMIVRDEDDYAVATLSFSAQSRPSSEERQPSTLSP